MNTFTHLRVHSEYSITKGMNRVDEISSLAAKNGMGAVAMTDTDNLFGAVGFYEAARQKGVKAIMGCELTMHEAGGDDNPKGTFSKVILLAKNQTGYVNLMKIISRGYAEGMINSKPTFKKEWFETNSKKEGIILLSGAKHGDVGQAILSGEMGLARSRAKEWQNIFNENYYIELQRDGTEDETPYMQGAVQIAQDLGIAPVATHPVLFPVQEDFLPHEVKNCVVNGELLYDRNRIQLYNPDHYFKTAEEMEALFLDIPQALQNTVEIAKQCNVVLSLGKSQLPHFNTPNNESEEDFLMSEAKAGLKVRLDDLFPDAIEREAKRPAYEDRLNDELKIIQKTGFPGYFLIVSDFIKWAKNSNIPVGPGRGSGAGSLVAYSLQITDLDPLHWNLLFERFLNPERVSMPDFDIDFADRDREKVINYVKRRYGKESVSQIVTFGTMAAKAAVKDVGRILGHNFSKMNEISKQINITPARPITLAEFVAEDEQFQAVVENNPELKKLVGLAVRVEGLTKQVGMHAGGVLIAPGKITQFCPIYKGSKDSPSVSQFNGPDVEKAGLVKFDFLGLKALSIIADAVSLINERADKLSNPFDIRKVKLDDQAVYQLFRDGNTDSVFQFESKGMKNTLKKAQPDNFEDLVALNAAFRPGPMELIPSFIARKHGTEETDYMHSSLKDVLKPTYGCIIYQEQVMQIARTFAGYTLGGADILRRAMGKKKVEVMEEQAVVFREGAKKLGNDPDLADKIFKQIAKFAGYGFNRSHAAAYSWLAFQTAHLKVHYPQEWQISSLNNEMGDTEKLSIVSKDARNNGVDILGVDINKSKFLFAADGAAIRYGFGALKGVAEAASIAIENARNEGGDFISFHDFIERIGKGAVNRKGVEQLIRAGAFDKLNPNRAELIAHIPDAMEYLVKWVKLQQASENPLDEIITIKPKKQAKELVRPEIIAVEPWKELNVLIEEKKATGFYFSKNPYHAFAEEVGGFKASTTIKEAQKNYQEEGVENALIGGIILEILPFKSKKGAFVKIVDSDGEEVEVIVFESTMTENKEWLKPDNFAAFVVKVGLDMRGEGISYAANDVLNLESVRILTSKTVFVAGSNDNYNAFRKIINENKGTTPIKLLIEDITTGRKTKVIAEGNIDPTNKAIEELTKEFGENWVKSTYLDTVNVAQLSSKNKKGGYDKKPRRALSV